MTSSQTPSILFGLTGLTLDGGISSVSRCIVQALDALAERGALERTDRVLLYDLPPGPTPPPAPSRQWLAGGSQTRFAWQAWRAIRRRAPDLFLVDLVGLGRVLRLPLPGFPPRRYAVFTHGLELTDLGAGRREVLAGAWRILANSELTAERVLSLEPRTRGRIHVVPLCIEPSRVAAWRDRASSDEAPREPAALIVGRMWPDQPGKGHDALIEGWPMVRERVRDAELWVVGGGDDRRRLEERARQLGLGESVRFLGRVPDDELGRLYRRASVFAMPSRQEGFGLVYLEAMWHGLPCIGSTADAAGCVIDPSAGVLVPYGDPGATGRAVGTLLDDPARARRMGEAGRKLVETRHSFEAFTASLLAALDLH